VPRWSASWTAPRSRRVAWRFSNRWLAAPPTPRQARRRTDRLMAA
jgi:hypothetical protein